MRERSLTVATVLALSVALAGGTAVVSAQETALTFTARSDGGTHWFTVEDRSGRNPDVLLAPSTTYDVTFVNDAEAAHDLRFGGGTGAQSGTVDPGDSTTLTVAVPDDPPRVYDYWSEPFREEGMEGLVYTEATEEFKEDLKVPGPSVLAVLAGLGAAAVIHRRRT